jgi:hypothetical protein
LRQSRTGASISRFLSGTSSEFGVYTADALNYTIYTSGNERMRITSGGNVGIGVTPPAWSLFKALNIGGSSVATNGSSSIILSRNWYYEGAEKYFENGNAQRIELVNNIFQFQTATTNTSGAGAALTWNTQMYLASTGNLLLNTTTDAGYKLDVNGSARISTLDIASQVGLSVSGYGFLSQTISGQMSILGHNVRASSNVANQVNVVNGGWISSMIKQYYNEGITFHTSPTFFSAGAVYPMDTTERMRIASNGDIGIGTNNPINYSGFTTVTVASNVNSGVLALRNASNFGLNLYGSNDGGLIEARDPSKSLLFVTNDTLRMRIFSSGNVFIGSSPTDAGFRLDVNGTGRFSGALTATSVLATTWVGAQGIRFSSSSPTQGVYLGNSGTTSADYATIEMVGGTAGGCEIDFTAPNVDRRGRIGYNNSLNYMWFETTDGTERMRIASNGAITSTSTVTATGFFQSSDERLKDIISRNGDVITYKWKDGRDNKNHVGYSAQEVQKVMPDAVNENAEDGMLSVNYIEVLVKKMAEMEKEIAYLKSKL